MIKVDENNAYYLMLHKMISMSEPMMLIIILRRVTKMTEIVQIKDKIKVIRGVPYITRRVQM